MAANSEQTAKPKKKGGPGRPFVKGQSSANPKGRPKVDLEFQARARKAVDDLVIARWERELSEDGPQWVKCSELLAAYGYGKPPQTIDLKAQVTAENPLAGMTKEEVLEVVRSGK